MNDEEFMLLMSGMKYYLEMPKTFITNPERLKEVEAATEIAKQLFPEANVTINKDPLQLGAVIVRIESDEISATDTEIPLFSEMVSKATNFEFYYKGNDINVLAMVFDDTFIRIPTGL